MKKTTFLLFLILKRKLHHEKKGEKRILFSVLSPAEVETVFLIGM